MKNRSGCVLCILAYFCIVSSVRVTIQSRLFMYKDVSPTQLLWTLAVSGLLVGAYLWGLVELARYSVWLEMGIVLCFPLTLVLLGKIKPHSKRTLYLVGVETWFLLMVILAKWSIALDFALGNVIAKWGIALFFVFQVGGFLVAQIKRKKWAGFLQSICGGGLIVLLFQIMPGENTVDSAGRFWILGAEVPSWMMAFYTFWVINVIFSDSKRFPHISQTWFQLLSVGIALFSGEFFHARLLTACHLFLLDIWLHYSIGEAPYSDLLRLPNAWNQFFERNIRERLAWTMFAAVLLVGFWAFWVSMMENRI